ncbi:DNA polymerase subunit beta [Desulfolithobacter dissulfuricans]|uniref:DNA polymerase subunit beta n=1 Tax=Desulfolithobacter dissulfuricans TaxID=2795293 RepID=A0A915XL63_9BACT|nr:nucleotidyltransferase family protein [Desulfolithobacter dissulfuricans]BCO09236.1 DNA polymerase subunit beta [Desulfolithobacter dissulfuricans]
MTETRNKLQRAEVLRILGMHRDELAKRYGVTKLGIFGSVARDEATGVSDVDVVVETLVPDLLRMVNLKEDLEKILHCKVDLVRYRPRMNPYLKKRLDKEARYV